MAITVNPLTPGIGAEILGVDLSAPLDDQQVSELRALWLKHLVLFFRDQTLSLDQHKAFASRFGSFHIHPNIPGHPQHPEALVIHADEKSKQVAGHGWHTDVSCDESPPSASILRLEQVPQSGGDTLFANMYAAYEALSSHWQNFLLELTAMHESVQVHGTKFYKSALKAEQFARAEHPVIRTHPETGRRLLYVNSAFTTRIKGMKPNESKATLAFLFDHLSRPDFQCRFSWRPNSIAMWDNRCAQHYATWDYFPEVRHGYRITLCGDKPFLTN